LQKWFGTYYYFDPTTYEMVRNQYLPVKWPNGDVTWYMFGKTGSIVTGLYKWFGTYYYFSPNTFKKVTNQYIPVTWPNGDVTWYMFDETGSIVTGLKEWCGSLYYFDPYTYEKVTSKIIYTNGKSYWANATGALSPYEITSFASRVQNFLNSYSNNTNVAISFMDLSNGIPSIASINGDQFIYAASVGKLPIVAYVQELVNNGKLSLDTKLQYTSAADYTNDHMIKGGTGSLQYENPEGKWYTIRELLTKDLIESDNAASNQLLYHIANANRKDFDNFLGQIAGISTYSKYMTANQVAKVMLYIHNQGGIANDLLSRTNWKNNKIGALPVKVEHKIGINGSINNDAAYVYASHPFILVVMSNGYSDNVISNIAWNIYNMQ
ncbi:serine hydrolase, partial [Limosilactobacillus coleohominis]|uniref:serine hydrolase n=1 Tax=Limosilactobacillus coleohominis TaxID=181675 RepID=UPI0019562B0B